MAGRFSHWEPAPEPRLHPGREARRADNLLLGHARFSAAYLTSCLDEATPKTISLARAVPVIVAYNVVDMDVAGVV